MAEQPNISQILAALAQQSAGLSSQSQPPLQQPSQPTYPPSYPTPNFGPGSAPFPIPQTNSAGGIDLSSIKPVNSGSVRVADAGVRIHGSTAEKGIPYGNLRGGNASDRDGDPRLAGRYYQRSRSRSRSPPRLRQGYRDSYNPYRDERRDDVRRSNVGYAAREPAFSSDYSRSMPLGSRFTPPPGRGFSSNNRSPMGQRVDDDGAETISIESGYVGLIIGRQGENLKRVEEITSTRVQFITGPEAGGPMRQCKITGTRAAREDAKAEINRIIEDHGRTAGASVTGRAPPPPDRDMGIGVKKVGEHQPALRAGEDATQIMVPNRTVGLIIGRGGETIRDLQERSQCHVNIVGEEKSLNGLRPVNLIGTPSAAAMAKELIMEIVESDTKSLANQGGANRDKTGPLTFGAGEVEKVNDRVVVPSEAVGMIIGKGGETIKNMQAETGCKINVTPATGRDVERDIGLVGSREAINRAKQAIMDKVQAVQEKNNRQAGSNARDGGNSRDSQQFNEPSFPNNTPAYGQQNSQQGGQPAAGGMDPYAAYGGYENYLALWYSSLQAQQNQPQTSQNGPPGS